MGSEMSNSLDKFGKVFIEEARDRSIRLFDKRIHGSMRDEGSQKLFGKVNSLSDDAQDVIKEIIPDVVDLCLHNMLNLFEENEDLQIIVDGENLNDMSDGLAGELYTSDGWIHRFSNERHRE